MNDTIRPRWALLKPEKGGSDLGSVGSRCAEPVPVLTLASWDMMDLYMPPRVLGDQQVRHLGLGFALYEYIATASFCVCVPSTP